MIDLPSKKVIVTATVVTALVVLIIGVSIKNKDAILNSGIFVNKSPSLNSNSEADLDDDGLLDWEEDMWGTDMSNPDTDGDGTQDGEEVRRGRNPLISGPDDFVEITNPEYFLVEQKQVSDNFEEGTVSDNLSKSLFSNFLKIEEDGSLGTLGSDADLTDIVSQAAGQVKFTDEYTISDINTFDANNIELLTTYANKLAQLEINKLISLAGMGENPTGDDTINIINDHHMNLISMNVPDTLAEIHLSITNDYSTFSEAVKNLDKNQADPVKAMISVQEVEGIQIRQSTHFSTLASYFRERGIIFNDNEEGILWNQY